MDFRILFVVVMATISLSTATDDILDETAIRNNNIFRATRANIQFAADVYKKLSSRPGNIMFSPLSAHLALTMTGFGANGSTSDEMSRALWMPLDKESRLSTIDWMIRNLRSTQGTMHLANKIYLANGFSINPSYRSIVLQNFKADIEKVDFAEPEEAADNINAWIEHNTANKIKNTVSPDELSQNTRMVLVNALYFKNDWLSPFEHWETTEEDFFLDRQRSNKVKMMHQSAMFNYARNNALGAEFLQLPYVGGEYIMTIVLPIERDGIANLENNLPNVFGEQEWKRKYVQLSLPKFKCETSIEMKPILQKLGMVRAFENNADFSTMTKEPVKIDTVIQKTFIEVDEEGTTAAAATVVGVVPLSLPISSNFYFNVDHPFLFFLHRRNVDQNVILFVGRIMHPRKM